MRIIMRLKTGLIPAFLFIVCAAVTWAGDGGVWVGTRFRPEQCLEIIEGKYDVTRKLCTIAYEIRSQSDHFAVNARLRFNKKFIPDNVSDVELEILLMDANRVCTKQLNIHKKVEAGKADFSFVAQKLPSQRYVRTYYIIHYR